MKCESCDKIIDDKVFAGYDKALDRDIYVCEPCKVSIQNNLLENKKDIV